MADPPKVSVGDPGAMYDQSPDLAAVLRRQWAIVLACALVGILVGALYSAIRADSYESRATLLLIAAGDEESPGGGRARSLDVETWATVARSTSLLRDVASQLGLELESVRARTAASPAPTGDVLVLSFTSADLDAAIEGATAYSEQFLDSRRSSINSVTAARQQRLEDLADDLRLQITELSLEITAEEAGGAPASSRQLAVLSATQQLAIERLGSVSAELSSIDTDADVGQLIIDPRTTATRTGVGTSIILLSGLLVGGLIGFVAALLRDRSEDSYRTASLGARLGVDEIARVPYIDRGPVEADGPAAYVYSRLLTRLTFSQSERRGLGRSILLLPVESSTIPKNTARSVASALVHCGRRAGLQVGVRTTETESRSSARPDRIQESTSAELREARTTNAVTLLFEAALDLSVAGVGAAALVDEVLLLVSDRTPASAIVWAVDDLRNVGADLIHVVVVTGTRQHRAGPLTESRLGTAVDHRDSSTLPEVDPVR